MNYLQRFSANHEGRDFVCGDLHGQVDELFQSMASVSFDPACDRLFSVGDLIDRGEDSQIAFELLDKHWFHAVRGNHEAMMFSAYSSDDDKDIAMWMNNGGKRWVADGRKFFQTNPAFCALLEQQQREMPWSIEVALRDGRRVGLIHAECPSKDWSQIEAVLSNPEMLGQAARYDALWSRSARDPGAGGTIANIDLTVHGHTVVPHPQRRFNCCYIDTGACLSSKRFLGLVKKKEGYLSLIRLEQLFSLA
ncbi:MAG: metallophosphoesterase [Motiliproteus sp.]